MLLHLNHPKGMGGGRGSVGKIFATIHVAALVVPFNLRSNFDLLTPRVVGSMGKIFPSMLLHSFSLLFDMQHDHIMIFLILSPRVVGGLQAIYLPPCCCI